MRATLLQDLVERGSSSLHFVDGEGGFTLELEREERNIAQWTREKEERSTLGE